MQAGYFVLSIPAHGLAPAPMPHIPVRDWPGQETEGRYLQ
jgi:hypothetical protein